MYVMYVIYQGIIIPIVIAAVCGAAAATVFFIVRNKRKNGKLSKKGIIVQGIQNNIDCFTDLFEPVYSISNGKNRKQSATFAAWNEKVDGSEDDNGYKALFKEMFGDFDNWGRGKNKLKVKKANKIYNKKAKKLLKLFKKADIIRGDEVYEIGGETTAEKYDYIGTDSIVGEESYEVLAPCWTYLDKVVDKGVIR